MKASKQNKDQDLIFEAYLQSQTNNEVGEEVIEEFVTRSAARNIVLKAISTPAARAELARALANNTGYKGIQPRMLRQIHQQYFKGDKGLNDAINAVKAAPKPKPSGSVPAGKPPTTSPAPPGAKPPVINPTAPPGAKPPVISPGGTPPAVPGAAGGTGRTIGQKIDDVTPGAGTLAKGAGVGAAVTGTGVGGVLAYQNLTPADTAAIQSNNIDLLKKEIENAEGERKIALQNALDKILTTGAGDATTRATQAGGSIMDRIGGAASKAFTTDGEIDYGKVAKAGAIGAGLGIGGKLAYDHLKPKKDKDEDEDEA